MTMSPNDRMSIPVGLEGGIDSLCSALVEQRRAIGLRLIEALHRRVGHACPVKFLLQCVQENRVILCFGISLSGCNRTNQRGQE